MRHFDSVRSEHFESEVRARMVRFLEGAETMTQFSEWFLPMLWCYQHIGAQPLAADRCGSKRAHVSVEWVVPDPDPDPEWRPKPNSEWWCEDGMTGDGTNNANAVSPDVAAMLADMPHMPYRLAHSHGYGCRGCLSRPVPHNSIASVPCDRLVHHGEQPAGYWHIWWCECGALLDEKFRTFGQYRPRGNAVRTA